MVKVMSVTSAELEQAQAAYARAFNRFGLGRSSDTKGVLLDAQSALGHLRSACPDPGGPGAVFILARIADTGILLGSLSSAPDVARTDVATGLLAVDFLLRAVHAQCDGQAAPTECISCHSSHLLWREGGTPDAPLYQCTDCGLTAPYPRR